MKKDALKNLTPEQKRAMLARLLAQKSAVGKTAFVLQGLYTICAMNNTPAWHMRSTIRFFRKQDPEMLRSRMQRIVDRHPALRTTYFIPSDKEIEHLGRILAMRIDSTEFWEVCAERWVEQKVHPKHTLHFTVTDARDWTVEQLRDKLMSDALEAYQLGQLPVCRLRLYQRKNDDVMQFDIHHCAADLWSLEIIQSELEVPPTGPPPAGFPEFCTWQHAWYDLPKAEEMREWWTAELEGCPNLALTHSEDHDVADFVSFQLDSELLARAREVCRAHRATLFNLMLSTLQVTVGRMLGRAEFAIGGTDRGFLCSTRALSPQPGRVRDLDRAVGRQSDDHRRSAQTAVLPRHHRHQSTPNRYLADVPAVPKGSLGGRRPSARRVARPSLRRSG